MAEHLNNLVAIWPWPALVATIVVAIVMLAKGAKWLVANAVALSVRWGVPRTVVGATVVSLGTTMPEAAVSVLAAVQGQSGMALGNAVGSIICDTGLILGIACLIAPLRFDPGVVNRQGWVQFTCGFLLVVACLPWTVPITAFTAGGSLPQIGGWLFLGLLTLYMAWSVRLARQAAAGEEPAVDVLHVGLAGVVFSLVAAVAIVVITSSVLITAAAELAHRVSVPPSIIAATLVAFGTSLPELTVVVTATLKGHDKTGECSPSDWDGPRPDEPQLPIYAVTADSLVVGVFFGRLKTGHVGFRGLAHSEGIVPDVKVSATQAPLGDTIRDWRDVLDRLGKDFRAGRAAVDPKDRHLTCRYCALPTLCRISQADDRQSERDDA